MAASCLTLTPDELRSSAVRMERDRTRSVGLDERTHATLCAVAVGGVHPGRTIVSVIRLALADYIEKLDREGGAR